MKKKAGMDHKHVCEKLFANTKVATLDSDKISTTQPYSDVNYHFLTL